MRTTLASIARRLESDARPSRTLDALASVWARASAARVRRPLSMPDGVHAIGIGGATLGGSGKTPLAIALARALAERGTRVTFVGHAYRAKPRAPRLVDPNDDVREVGDEALVAARALATFEVPVIVGPTRQSAVDFALSRRAAFVFDGVLQTSPRPLTHSLLALDESSPWGNGRCPPAGDLCAPREALLAATDAIIPIGFGPQSIRAHLDGAARAGGREVPLAELRSMPFGLVFTIARPARVTASLARNNLVPSVVLDFGDHAHPNLAELERAAAKEQRVKIWLTTPKCATKLPPEIAGAPVLALGHRLELPKALVDWALSNGPLPAVFCPSSPGQKAW